MFLEPFLSVGALVLVAAGLALVIVATVTKNWIFAAFAVIPVALLLLVQGLGVVEAFGLAQPLHPLIVGLLVLTTFLLGVLGGSPLTLFVLGLAERHPVAVGEHGGIVPETVTPEGAGAKKPALRREVLRGGATIGYLERVAVLGSILTGQFAGIAVVVAIKGLGRFSELDSPEARERFIIGTLVSIIWAGACAVLITLVMR